MKYSLLENTSVYLPDPLPAMITYGYYLPGGTTPAEISLTDSWSAFKGYYFFLTTPIPPTDTAALTELNKNLTAEPSLQKPLYTGACWWANTPGSSAMQSVLQTNLQGNNVTVYTNINLGFGLYQLPLFQGGSIIFQPEGILSTGYPIVPDAQTAAAAQGISFSAIGDQAGILTGQVMMNSFSNDEFTGWSAGFRYNMPSPITGIPCSQYYPLFNNTPTTYWVLNLHWDPLHPLDPDRSYMAFTGISFGLEKIADTNDQFQMVPASGKALDSWWRTIYGQPVTLRPITDGSNPAQLVFQLYANPLQSPAYYLAPKGAFELQATPDKDGVCQLLPGLSGTESIRFAPGDDLLFYPGNAANAGSGLASQQLDNKYTTSWAFIQAKSAHPIVYSAAPAVASLYQASPTAGLLDAWYAPTAQLPATGTDTLCFPVTPYAGIDAAQTNAFPPDSIATFESQLIAVAREQRMAALPLPAVNSADAGTVTTTTPQGLLATISGLTWQEVLLARNTELSVDFRFTNLPPVLRNAFQTEDLFLVISDATNIGTFDNALSIEGWQFNINVPTRNPQEDPEQKNILLLKFRKGAITDLVLNTNQWTDPATFNYDANQVVSTQTWLMEYCNEAITMAATDPQFASFAAIVQDPEWYGILALRTDINLGNFPTDLRGLLGAMDLTRFYAHHVGVQVNFVQQDTSNTTQPLSVKKSNMFGMISYIDPAYQQTQGGSSTAPPAANKLLFEAAQNNVDDDVAYAYKVLILQVIFANTVLTNFNSKLELTARKWFEDAASLNVPGKGADTDPANYSMIFDGHYENHDGHRTYTFLTQRDLTYQYFLASKVLNYIEFVKAQFQTISNVASAASTDTENINARFTFYGFLNFNTQDKFDCFSYGSEAGQEELNGRGLYFSNLSLDVSFSLNTVTNTTSGLKIVLNPSNVSFDQSMSTFRSKSFAAAFPISPNAIFQGTGDSTPKKRHYLPVVPPVDFSTAGIQPVWYAINFDMHWGGAGSLASQAGFIPQLMLAWSPGATSVNVEIFVRLPGSGGGNTFSIQNVLKLSAGPFQLKQVEHSGDKISYNFFLINLSLSLFGIKLPPAGNTNLVLIGDAEAPGTLGWYGAYINK
jgi:hypothetical protein